MMKIQLDRPLAVFDIESTGLNRQTDRIIDLAIIKLMPDGSREQKTYRVNPGIPIPAESSAIHGITDDDVKDCPAFEAVAQQVADFIGDADLGGFNIIHFDIPMLLAEFARAGIAFSIDDRRTIDSQRIFHRKEPRDLSAALQFYCGRDHEGAHSAFDDVEATIDVLNGQFERYEDLPTSPDELDEFCNPRDPNWIDRTGRLKWNENDEPVINFGKNANRRLKDLALLEGGFLKWILKSDFPLDTKEIIRDALNGKFPARKQGERPEE